MKSKLDKEKVIKAARVAKGQTAEGREFWTDVRKRMDIREKSLVKPRR